MLVHSESFSIQKLSSSIQHSDVSASRKPAGGVSIPWWAVSPGWVCRDTWTWFLPLLIKWVPNLKSPLSLAKLLSPAFNYTPVTWAFKWELEMHNDFIVAACVERRRIPLCWGWSWWPQKVLGVLPPAPLGSPCVREPPGTGFGGSGACEVAVRNESQARSCQCPAAS